MATPTVKLTDLNITHNIVIFELIFNLYQAVNFFVYLVLIMSQPQSRSLIAMIFRNFINSLKPRKIFGDLKGSDYFGNKYFEIPANPSVGKRRASRWFEPPEKGDFQQELPAEWESWLRHRRKEPPSDEEVMRNYALMLSKKQKAIEVDKKGSLPAPMTKGMETFPQRPDYEVVPGKPRNNNK